MKIIEYFKSENKERWLAEIKRSDWGAAHFLHNLLQENRLEELIGENARVLLLVNGDDLVSFCTLAEKDDIQPTELTPWIGWIYTFPEHRGKHLAGKLIAHAEYLAKQDGASSVHISTNHIGLYEKYGYELLAIMKDIEGKDTRAYVKRL